VRGNQKMIVPLKLMAVKRNENYIHAYESMINSKPKLNPLFEIKCQKAPCFKTQFFLKGFCISIFFQDFQIVPFLDFYCIFMIQLKYNLPLKSLGLFSSYQGVCGPVILSSLGAGARNSWTVGK